MNAALAESFGASQFASRAYIGGSVSRLDGCPLGAGARGMSTACRRDARARRRRSGARHLGRVRAPLDGDSSGPEPERSEARYEVSELGEYRVAGVRVRRAARSFRARRSGAGSALLNCVRESSALGPIGAGRGRTAASRDAP